MESKFPSLPRVDEIADSRVPLLGTGRELNIAPDDRIGAWMAHALAVVEILRDILAAGTGENRVREAPTNSAMRGEDRALALLVAHPDWTDVQIAKAADVRRTTLYDYPKYKAARASLKDGKRCRNDRRKGRTGTRLPDTLPDTPPDAWDDETLET
jgi:hypothetical protein